MILIGLGSNLCGEEFDNPQQVLEAAFVDMAHCGITIIKRSRFYESEPVPKSDQPWFVNAVVSIETELDPSALLHKLHKIEANLGRKRRIRWEARIIDLDIIAYQDRILPTAEQWPAKDVQNEIIIPHPRSHERLFVLKPLMDISRDWTHPVLGKTAEVLAQIVEKETDQGIIRLLD